MLCNYILFRKQMSETLNTHHLQLTVIKTDISTAHDQVRMLSTNHNDVISTVITRLKQRLAENEALSLKRLSQLKTQYNRLNKDKENSEAENKRLINALQQVESQYRCSEETSKSVISELQKELNGTNIYFTIVYFCVTSFYIIV